MHYSLSYSHISIGHCELIRARLSNRIVQCSATRTGLAYVDILCSSCTQVLGYKNS